MNGLHERYHSYKSKKNSNLTVSEVTMSMNDIENSSPSIETLKALSVSLLKQKIQDLETKYHTNLQINQIQYDAECKRLSAELNTSSSQAVEKCSEIFSKAVGELVNGVRDNKGQKRINKYSNSRNI